MIPRFPRGVWLSVSSPFPPNCRFLFPVLLYLTVSVFSFFSLEKLFAGIGGGGDFVGGARRSLPPSRVQPLSLTESSFSRSPFPFPPFRQPLFPFQERKRREQGKGRERESAPSTFLAYPWALLPLRSPPPLRRLRYPLLSPNLFGEPDFRGKSKIGREMRAEKRERNWKIKKNLISSE